MILLTECPRDAMQGIKHFIPTKEKVEYLNTLLKVGFTTLDCGSFVSPKAIPQMQDTPEVLKKINYQNSSTKLSVIVANKRGAEDAVHFEQVSFLGYPFSISETFQLRNTNATIEQSLTRVEEIVTLCENYKKTPLLYISMAFGNPYNDQWSAELAQEWVKRLHNEFGILHFSMADTIGVSNPKNIVQLFSTLITTLPHLSLSAHLHTTPETGEEKVEAILKGGCQWIEGALKGYGGCPMAKDELTGNMPTEKILNYLEEKNYKFNLNRSAFEDSLKLANRLFL